MIWARLYGRERDVHIVHEFELPIHSILSVRVKSAFLKESAQRTILTEYAKKIQVLLQRNHKSYSLVSLRVNKYFIFNFG